MKWQRVSGHAIRTLTWHWKRLFANHRSSHPYQTQSKWKRGCWKWKTTFFQVLALMVLNLAGGATKPTSQVWNDAHPRTQLDTQANQCQCSWLEIIVVLSQLLTNKQCNKKARLRTHQMCLSPDSKSTGETAKARCFSSRRATEVSTSKTTLQLNDAFQLFVQTWSHWATLWSRGHRTVGRTALTVMYSDAYSCTPRSWPAGNMWLGHYYDRKNQRTRAPLMIK